MPTLFERIEAGALNDYQTVRTEARFAIDHPVEALHSVERAGLAAGKWVYDQALGTDIKTLCNPNASSLDKVLAGVSIASNFVGPEGKLLDKGLTFVAKEALEHGGERVLAKGAKRLEETLGKDAFRTLVKDSDRIVESLKHGTELAEKAIERLNIARGLKDSITHTLEDGRATIEDFGKALKAAPGERPAAWARVGIDLAKDGKDVFDVGASVLKGKESLHPSEVTLAKLQHEATETVLQDAARFKAEGRTFVKGADLVIDVRDSKNFREHTVETLRTMQKDAAAEHKHMVVYDPKISNEQERELLESGISVAKNRMDLQKLSVAARLHPQRGVELVNLDRRIEGSEIVQAIHDRKESNELRDSLANAEAFVRSGPAEVGRSHESAKSWNGKALDGVVSFARDGEVQIYGHGKWTKFEAIELRGDHPTEGQRVSITSDPAHPGKAIVHDEHVVKRDAKAWTPDMPFEHFGALMNRVRGASPTHEPKHMPAHESHRGIGD